MCQYYYNVQELALGPVSHRRATRLVTMMKQMTKFRSEYSLRALPLPFSPQPPPPSVLTDWHPLSSPHTFLKWRDSHYYYKYRDTYQTRWCFNTGYSVTLRKQGKAYVLVLATRVKIALPSRFLNLFSLSYNPMTHHLTCVYRKHFSMYKAHILFPLILITHLAGS